MGGEVASKKSLWGNLGDESRAPQGGWLAVAAKAADGAEAEIGGPGGEVTEGERETDTDKEMTQWEKVVALVRMVFGEGWLAEESTRQAVVLIPKGKGDYLGIGLVEVVWKVVAAILNHRLTSSIIYHNFLHGLRAGRGTGTSTLEAKPLQQLAAMREEILYVIFLDLYKACGALDRDICLEILEGYGVGP